MPNNSVTCGSIRDRPINLINWERHTSACTLKNINNKRKKIQIKYSYSQTKFMIFLIKR